MKEDEEPKTWVSALKIVIALAVVIGAIGFGLWYASQLPESSPAMEKAIEEVRQKSPRTDSSRDGSWGISKDSPLRR